MRMAGAAFAKGLECFTQALALEPTYAQAHAGIAMVQGLRTALSFVGPHTVMPMAKEAALKGLAIDETVADAHLALAMVLQFYEWNWAGAEREYRLALDLNPGDANARRWYAVLLAQRGHKDPAIAGARHAVERDPLEVNLRHSLSLVLCMAGRFEAARSQRHTPDSNWIQRTFPYIGISVGRWPVWIGATKRSRRSGRLQLLGPQILCHTGGSAGRWDSPGRDKKPSRSLENLSSDEGKRTSVVPCLPGSVWGWATMIKPSHGCTDPPRNATGY